MSLALLYPFRRTLGLALRHVKTCRTRPPRKQAELVFTRTRPLYAVCLIRLSNRYLGWSSTGLSILPTCQWLDWECRLHAELSGLIAQRGGRRILVLPQIEGEELAVILSSPDKSLQYKSRSLRLAAAALVHAHHHSVLYPDGVSRPFSHGDATARNVICNFAGSHATWIDFETVHDPRRTVAWRQADDLRALIWSAAEITGPDAYSAVCNAVLSPVSDAAILSELECMTANVCPAVYHFAQGSLSFAHYRRLCDILALATVQRRSQGVGIERDRPENEKEISSLPYSATAQD